MDGLDGGAVSHDPARRAGLLGEYLVRKAQQHGGDVVIYPHGSGGELCDPVSHRHPAFKQVAAPQQPAHRLLGQDLPQRGGGGSAGLDELGRPLVIPQDHPVGVGQHHGLAVHIQSALQQMVLAGAALVSDSGLQMVADQSAQLGDRIQI